MKLFARRMIGVKQETTQNNFVAPDTAAFVAAHDFTVKPVVEQLSTRVVAATLGSPANVTGKESVDIDIKLWGKGSGTTGTKYAPFDALMGACGFSGSQSGSGAIMYSPLNAAPSVSQSGPCLTTSVSGEYDGVTHNIAGVAGTMKWVLEAAKKWEIEFSGKGRVSSSGSTMQALAVDASMSASAYTNTVKEPVIQNVSFLVNGYQLTIDKLEIDFGADVQMIDDINAPHGNGGFTIVDRKPVGSFQALMVNVASHDFFGNLESNTVMSGSVTIGIATGNTYVLNLPSLMYSNVQYANKNGFIAVNATLKFNDDPNSAVPWMTVLAS